MRLRFLWLCVFLTTVLAVNRDNFKNCKTSSFCHRQRELSQNAIVYQLLSESLFANTFGVKANLSRIHGNQILTLDVTHLTSSTFRVTVDEPGLPKARYRLGTRDSLQGSLQSQPVKVVKSSDSVALIGPANEKAVIFFNPFSINFYVDGVLVNQFNRRGLFNFELAESPVHQAELETSTESSTESTTTSSVSSTIQEPENLNTDNTDPTPPVENVDTENHSTAAEPDQQDKGGEQESVEPALAQPPDPFPWAENFKEHRDTRPYGPMSISLDVDFPGFSNLYGIPEHADTFNLRSTANGDPYRLYNLDVFEYELNNPMALYGSVPVLWALNANYTVGLFWHNPSETWVDIEYTDHPNEGFLSKIPRLFTKTPERYANSRWVSESGVMDVFVMLGREPQSISNAYAHLTGHTPLPPLFALGYHQSRWNYKDEHDVLSVDQSFDQHGIPADVIWLDIEHTDGKRYFTWDKPKFPNPGEMVDKLLTKGRKLVTVVDPHIKKDSSWSIYKEGVENNYYVKTRDGSDFIGWCWPGSSAWPDFTSEAVRRWWSERFLTYDPVRIDTMFSWNDMGEPSVFSGPEITMDKDAIHEGGREHRDVHNIYGLLIHQSTWDGQLLRSGGRERPFVLTRAFFAGSQRTAAVWTGDNTANWEHLQISIPMALSLSLTGITLCGADVGGFFGNTEPELLTRWYQAGAYQPFFRSHKHMDTKRHEPWTLPEEYLKVVRQAIVDRYRLLPYWYTTFARAEADGQPVMAPIWYHFRHVDSTFALEHEYMIGESILVCPVTKPGVSSVDVYLPPGVWYHHSTFEAFSGGQQISYPVNLATTPVFYRGGSIIPRRERIRRSSWLMRNDPFTLLVLLDPEHYFAQGYLYDDDYHSVSPESARFYRIEFNRTLGPTTRVFTGGSLRMTQLPIPGLTSQPPLASSPLGSKNPQLERIVFIGLPQSLTRVTLESLKSGEHRNLEFLQTRTLSADAQYYGTRKDGFAVIRCPGLAVSSDWLLHLFTSNELVDEL